MSGTWVYWNGQFLAREQVSIALEDLGFLWGATVTDRVRVFGGRPFLLEEHFARFRRSAQLAHIPLHQDNVELRHVAEELLARNGATGDQSIVFVATPGVGSQPTLIAYTIPITASLLQWVREHGVRLRIAFHLSNITPAIKHRSRLAWWIAKEEIRRHDPQAEPLLADENGHLLETTTANIVAVFDGTVTSPPRQRILPGISLDYLEKLCRKSAIPFVEREIPVEELMQASEVMVSNSTLSLAWVARINELIWERPGPLFQQLSSEWERDLGASIHGATTRLD